MLTPEQNEAYAGYLAEERDALGQVHLAFQTFNVAAYGGLVQVYATTGGTISRSMMSSLAGYYQAALDALVAAVKDIVSYWLRRARYWGGALGGYPVNTADSQNVDRLIDYWMERLASDVVNETTRGLMRGYAVGKTQRLIEGRSSVAESSVERILRAEGHKSHQAASLEAAESAGATHKIWVGILDNRIRHDHREAHGQERPLDEPFVVGGELAMYPSAPGLSPENSVNCRCVMAFVKK